MKNCGFELSYSESFQPIATFVLKTYSILAAPQNAQMIAWNPDGNSFSIKDNKQFVSQVLPKYFRHKKYESFIRQLNMYGFSKQKNHQKPCFSNSNFKRNREDLLKHIHRKQEKKKRLSDDVCISTFQKIDRFKEDDEVSVALHFKQEITLLQVEILKTQKKEDSQPSLTKKVTFKQQLEPKVQSNYSILMKPSREWLEKEEFCWEKIKSFQSLKISMQFLQDCQESVHLQKCLLAEQWNHTLASCRFLESATLKHIAY